MFSFLSGVVLRRPWVIVLAWLALTLRPLLFRPALGPGHQGRRRPVLSRPAPLSVIGQDLLERGFPRDASSSQLVLVYERKDHAVTPADRRHLEDVAANLFQFARSHPELGIDKRPDSPAHAADRPPADRQERGRNRARGARDRASSREHTFPRRRGSRSTAFWNGSRTRARALPPGSNMVVTGSAAVGRDTNAAATESIKNTTYSTIGLVVLILLIVYRSPLLAMIPLVTIALSVFVSLRLIALLTFIPGLGFKVINITQVFVVVVLFGAGTDYCLFLIARYCEELHHRKIDGRCTARGDLAGRRGPGRQRRHGDRRAGNALLLDVCQGQVHRPDDRAFARGGPARGPDAGPGHAGPAGQAIFWPFRSPHLSAAAESGIDGPDHRPAHGFWGRVADLVVAHPVPILSVCLLVLLPLAVVGARTQSNHNQLSDLDADTPSVIGTADRQALFRRRRIEPGGRARPPSRSRLPIAAGPADDRRAQAAGCSRSRTSPRFARSLSRSASRLPTDPDRGFFNRFAGQAVGVAAESRYVGTQPADAADRNHITRLDLVFKTDPFSEASLHALEEVHNIAASRPPPPDSRLAGAASIGIAGSSSMLHDLKSVTTLDQRKMYFLVTIGVYADPGRSACAVRESAFI